MPDASWPLLVVASPVLVATPGRAMIPVIYRSSGAVLLLGVGLAFERRA